jgi:hypothetical protein
MKKLITVVILILVILGAGFLVWKYEANKKALAAISSFQECVAKGFPVLESYPRQCKTPDGRTFTEDIGNALEKQDLIKVTEPLPNAVIQSPLTIRGEARGFWFFEASFPVQLLDGNGNEVSLSPSYIMTQGEWMTENFVPFEAQIEFQKPATKTGTLILKKDNPSDLPQNADELRIPVSFGN